MIIYIFIHFAGHTCDTNFDDCTEDDACVKNQNSFIMLFIIYLFILYIFVFAFQVIPVTQTLMNVQWTTLVSMAAAPTAKGAIRAHATRAGKVS